MSVAHDTTDRQHYAAQGKERDLELAVASLEALEGKHRHFAYQQPAEEHHEEEEEEGIESGTCQPCVAAGYESSPKDGIGRCGHADESCVLTFVDIELC